MRRGGVIEELVGGSTDVFTIATGIRTQGDLIPPYWSIFRT